MSIVDEIAARVGEGRLFLLRPPDKRVVIRRSLLLTRAINEAVVAGPWQSPDEEIRLSVVLRTELERFVIGDPLWLTINGAGRPKLEDMKRLSGTHEVWEYKGKAAPQIRVFGRFARRDEFIATNWKWRRDLSDDDISDWKREFRRCQTSWRNLFSTYPPHGGENIHEYVTGAQDTRLARR